MILGAGQGTRLRPLTERIPKILVPVAGVPMLDRLRAYLGRQGVAALALNTHHRAEAVRAHLASHAAARVAPRPARGSGATQRLPPLRLFHEPELLGTGGALVNAAAFWGTAPLLVWNGDILADVAPRALLAAHEAARAAAPAGRAPLATLVVQARSSDSYLLVDADGAVCGLDSARRGSRRVVGTPREPLRPLAFDGISLLAPSLRERLPAGGTFDLVLALLDAIAAGARVQAWDAGAAAYGTTGSPEQLAALEALLAARPELLAAWTP
jgi:NDP-sugar pyrophosphorylase family protein